MPPEDGFDIAELYRQYREEMRLYVLKLSGSEETANELTQDVFLAAHRYARTFDPARGEARPWLYSIARNTFFRYAKKNNLKGTMELTIEPADVRGTPESGINEELISGQVRKAVAGLPEPERSIVKMKYFEKATLKECSEKLGLSLSTTARRLTDAVKLLKIEFQRLGIEV